MTHQELLTDRVDLFVELDEARATWLGEKAVSAFANFEPIDGLLDELNDLDRAIEHGEMTDYGMGC